MDFDDINEKIGGCGLYHYILFFLLSLTSFKEAVDLQGLTFALLEPIYKCDITGIDTNNTSSHPGNVSEDQCSYRRDNKSHWILCDKWTYNKEIMKSSLITEFNLICTKEHYRGLIYSVFFISDIAGYPIVILSDKIGRRYMLYFFLFLSVPITLIQVFVYNLYVAIIFIFFSGVTRCVYICLAFSTLAEMIPNEKFDLAVTNFWILYCVGYMSTSAFAYFIRSWRIIFLMSLVFSVLYPIYICFVPETPRWLMVKGRKEESYKVLSFIAKINKRRIDKNVFKNWKPKTEESGSIWKLLRYKRMVVRSFIVMVAAWSFSFAYIGISTDLTFASDNIFITTLFMGIVEIPTGPLASLVARKMSRLNGINCLSGLGIICMINLPFIESDLKKSFWQPWLKVIVAMGGKLGFTSAWCLLDVIINEIFPTSIRNGGISITYFGVCLGSIMAPIIQEYALKVYFAGPCFIYVFILISTAILIRIFLPETKNLPLPQTIEDAVMLVKNKELEWKMFMTKKSVQCLQVNEESM